MLYGLAWIVLWPFLRLCFRAAGREFVPRRGRLVVVSNHMHDLDPFMIGPFLPFGTIVHWLAKKELYSPREIYREYLVRLEGGFPSCPAFVPKVLAWPLVVFIAFVVRHSCTIPVDREIMGAKINREAVRRSLEILRSGGVVGVFGEGGINRSGEAHPIFVALAKKTGSPVLPVKVHRRGVTFGRTVPVSGDTRDNGIIAKEIMEKIYGLAGENGGTGQA